MKVRRIIHRFLAGILILAFMVSDVSLYAQGVIDLPVPGTRMALSPTFAPPLLKGIKVYRHEPFRFDFILDKGDVKATDEGIKSDSTRLIKYFLASLAVPEKDLWVNLSPYEKDRIVPEAFGQTEMGRDLLAQDYILKQITASVIYPDEKAGKEFWGKVYAEALERYGITDVPLDTFNKVWIIPEKATVFENKDSAFVVESKLKVMLEDDYLALEKNTVNKEQYPTAPARNKLGTKIIREVVIPILEKEVNEGKNFVPLRQVYNSLILATWYKRKMKASIMGQAYVDQKKIGGIDIIDKNEKEKIWSQYVEAFKKGAFNFIKDETDPVTQEIFPRKYFSGGTDLAMANVFKIHNDVGLTGIPLGHADMVQVDMSMSSTSDSDARLPVYAWDQERVKAVKDLSNSVEKHLWVFLEEITRVDAVKELLKQGDDVAHKVLQESGLLSGLRLKEGQSWKDVLDVLGRPMHSSPDLTYNPENYSRKSLLDLLEEVRRDDYVSKDFDPFSEESKKHLGPARFPLLGLMAMSMLLGGVSNVERRSLNNSFYQFSQGDEYEAFTEYLKGCPASVFFNKDIVSSLSFEDPDQPIPSEIKRLFYNVLSARGGPEVLDFLYASAGSYAQDALRSADPRKVLVWYLSRENQKGPATRALEISNVLLSRSNGDLKDDISLFTISRCPFRCPGLCIAKNVRGGKRADLPKEEVYRRIEQIRGVSRIRFSGPGEPMAYGKKNILEPGVSQDFIDTVTYAAKAAKEVYVVTNGSLIPNNKKEAKELFALFPRNVVWVLSVDPVHSAEMKRLQQGRNLYDVADMMEDLVEERVINAHYFLVNVFSENDRMLARRMGHGIYRAQEAGRVTIFPEVRLEMPNKVVEEEDHGLKIEPRGGDHVLAHSITPFRTDLYIDMDGYVVGSNHMAYIPHELRSNFDGRNVFGNVNEMSLANILLVNYAGNTLREFNRDDPEVKMVYQHVNQMFVAYFDHDKEKFMNELAVLENMPEAGKGLIKNWFYRDYDHTIVNNKRYILSLWLYRYLPGWFPADVKGFLFRNHSGIDELVSEGSDFAEVVDEKPDQAMKFDGKGGIDLDPALMELKTKDNGEAVSFNLDPAMLQRLNNADGVTPVIVGIHPLDSLQQFLGVPKFVANPAGD